MRKNKIAEAELYGQQCGESLFNDFFENPSHRGPRFTWTWLIDWVGEYAKSQVALNMPRPKSEKKFEEMKYVAHMAASAKCAELVKKHNLIEKSKDAHTEHCCEKHGCKYGQYGSCTVTTGLKKQSYPCEDCDEDARIRIGIGEKNE